LRVPIGAAGDSFVDEGLVGEQLLQENAHLLAAGRTVVASRADLASLTKASSE
jgi:hypothetical protein